jgi:predicted Zn-dependent protease
LALKLARRSVELTPENTAAQETLAWALFRAGKYQACVDILDKHQKDKGPQSIYTMALWKVGRRDDALELFEQAAVRVGEWEQSEREKKARNVTLFPTTSIIRRLQKEADSMLASSEATKPAPSSAERQPAGRP